jgi:hypothetical protein
VQVMESGAVTMVRIAFAQFSRQGPCGCAGPRRCHRHVPEGDARSSGSAPVTAVAPDVASRQVISFWQARLKSIVRLYDFPRT